MFHLKGCSFQKKSETVFWEHPYGNMYKRTSIAYFQLKSDDNGRLSFYNNLRACKCLRIIWISTSSDLNILKGLRSFSWMVQNDNKKTSKQSVLFIMFWKLVYVFGIILLRKRIVPEMDFFAAGHYE